MDKRIVITGMGVMTSLGKDIPTFWNHLLQGKSGISRVENFDIEPFTTQIGGEIKDFEPEQYLDRKHIKRMDRYTQLGAAAALMAVENSGLTINEENAHRVGVYVGSGVGGLKTWEEQHEILLTKGPKRVSPFLIPMMIANMASGMVSIMTGAKGPNSAPVSACATGTHAIGDAAYIIKRGHADVMICGGTEAPMTPVGFAGFNALRALSVNNDNPQGASRPFDKNRDGFVMGEGAGVLVIESLEHALERGAHIIAEFAGYGMTGDAHHMTSPSPDGEGAARSMAMALQDGGLQPEEIDYINAHGTSTEMNDKFETLAIKNTFKEHAYKLAISSTKSMTGHLLGAAGGIEAIASILSIRDQVVAPTINLETVDPECDLDYVPLVRREMPVKTALSNSLGFGGHNATIIFKAYQP